MLLLLTAIFFLKHFDIQAAPLSAPDLTTAMFEGPIFARDDDSNGCQDRTVLDILWSCLATTFACTWVSVHPNVPFKGEGKWTLLRRRIFLMFFSILAPEFMIMWAFKQWRGAVMIRETVNEAMQKEATDKQKPVRGPWTTTHGHLLQMGGFRIRATARENFFWGGSPDLGTRSARPLAVDKVHPIFGYISRVQRQLDDSQTLGFVEYGETREGLLRDLITENVLYRRQTSNGSWTADFTAHDESTDNIWEGVLTFDNLRRLLSEDLIQLPAITEDEIDDKSKGDALSKGLALLQLAWFIVQIVTRVVQGLAVTELELTTVALAGLNSVMYIFWWSKPRDLRFPVVIRTKGVEELLAERHSEDVKWRFSDREFDIGEHVWTSMTTWIEKAVKRTQGFPRRLTLLRKPVMSENEDRMPLAVHAAHQCKSESSSKRYALTISDRAKMATKSAFVPFFGLIYTIDVVLFIPIRKILKYGDDTSISQGFFAEVGGFDVYPEDKLFSMIFYSENAGVKSLLATSSITGALFGAVHCLAWHFSFPTHAEQVMWRTASVGLVGSCCATVYTVLFHTMYMRTQHFWETVTRLLQLFGFLLCFLASLIYPVARFTLLGLAITSLRSLPSSAFDTVEWTEFVPHI